MALAIFDLDNTLIAGDSDHRWGEFLIAKGLVDSADYRKQNDGFYHDYQAGTLDIAQYLRFALKPLTMHSMDALTSLHREFMAECVQSLMLPQAVALLQRHKKQGDFLLIITATNAFVARPIAEYLGVDDIIATEPEIKGNLYTGNFLGTPCFQGGKIINLNHWLKEHQYTLDDSYFYSDSINDLPLLECVSEPVVVNGDDKLRAIAEQRHWKQLDLRT